MDINELRNFIEESSVNFYLVEKPLRQGQNYTLYEADVEDIVATLKEQLVESLHHEKFGFPQTPFDTLVAEDEILEICRNGDPSFLAINDFIQNSLEGVENHPEFIAREIHPQSISFYCVKFFDATDIDVAPIYFFRRMYKSSRLQRGIKGIFERNTFHQLNGNIFSFDAFPDVLVREDEALILNRNSFSIIFDLNAFYLQTVDNLLNTFANQFTDVQQFKEDCIESRLMLKKLTRLARNPQIIQNVLNRDVDELREIIEENNLVIEVNEQGQIIYNGDVERMVEIANFMSDAYYKTLILSRDGIEK